jgi:hypothetical protein
VSPSDTLVRPLDDTEQGNLKSALAELADLIAEATLTASRLRAVDYSRRLVIGKQTTTTTPVPDITTLARAKGDIDTWAYRFRVDHPTADTAIGDPIGYLTRYQGPMRTWARSRDLLATLEHHCAALNRAIDRPPARLYTGECDTCGNRLMADTDADTVTCRRCRDVYQVAERRTVLLDQAHTVTLTATGCARLLTSYGMPVNAATIRQWAKRGHVIRRGTNTAGDPTYRVGDIIDRVTAAEAS